MYVGYQAWTSGNIKTGQSSSLFTQQNTVDDILYHHFTQQVIHSKTIQIIWSTAKWERENKRKQRLMRKKIILEGRQIYASLMHADFLDISRFSPSLLVSYTKPPHILSKITNNLYICTSHLTTEKSFYFMQPKWNSYIKGSHGYSFTSTMLNNPAAHIQSY